MNLLKRIDQRQTSKHAIKRNFKKIKYIKVRDISMKLIVFMLFAKIN